MNPITFPVPTEALEGGLEAPPGFLEKLPVAVYACDEAGNLLWFNRRASALWGRTPRVGDSSERYDGAYKLYCLDGTPLPRDTTPMAYVLKTGEPLQGQEAVMERPDGSRLVTRGDIDPVRDRQGALLGAIHCFYEVTELHGAQRLAEERAQRFQQLLEALPAALYATDAEGYITFFNPASVELSGHTPKLYYDQWCVTWRLNRPDGTLLPHDQCPMAVALKENRPVRGVEAVVERPDGSRIPVLPYPTPLWDASGKLIGAVNLLVDISGRREAETQQKMLLDELNHRVKNNMQMLHSLLRVAQREARNAEVRAILSDVVQRVGAMANAQQVLYSAQNPGGFHTQDFIDMLCGTARHTFGKKIEIHEEVPPGSLSNDTAMPLALILNELLTNAVKYRRDENGPAVVKVGLFRTGDVWTLRVEDDGPGFDFVQSNKRSSGLGLVVGLARQLGGKLEITRTPGACCVVQFREQRSVYH